MEMIDMIMIDDNIHVVWRQRRTPIMQVRNRSVTLDEMAHHLWHPNLAYQVLLPLYCTIHTYNCKKGKDTQHKRYRRR
jgi:hypothetical protein